MIIDHIDNLDKYLFDSDVKKINVFLKIGVLGEKKWEELDGNNLKVIRLSSHGFSENTFETHKRFLDLHITIHGEDIIYLSNDKHAQVITPYKEDEDYALFKTQKFSCSYIPEGYFALIDAGELHTNKFNQEDTIKLVFKKSIL